MSRRRGETRWPAAVAVAVAIVVQVFASERLVPGPRLLLPGAEAVLLVALIAADPNRLDKESRDLRVLSLPLVALVAGTNALALGRLVDALLHGGGGSGRSLLGAAAGVWLTNVVAFALGYWELDRGGPLGRAGVHPQPGYEDLYFPQDADATIDPGWRPTFVDYLFVSLTAATAFSPTDTMPLTPRVKLLMGTQSLISLLTIGLVAARAVNVLS